MIIETFKLNMTSLGFGEGYDYNRWEMECVHVIHIFELLLEQLDMDENDSVCFFDETKPGTHKVWKMYSWNSTFQVVARIVQDNEVADCPTSD